jgi:hypothetical protein
MSISSRKNNKRRGERRKASFALACTTGTYILALTLLSSIFVFISPMQITTTTFAQEEENNTTADETTTITGNTSTPTTPSSALELSPQPIWQEQVTITGVTQVNETHDIVEFVGNGTMTIPGIEEPINMTNNGTAIISPVAGSAGTVSAYGREHVFSEDDDDTTTAITFYDIVQYDPATFQGKGLAMAVFDTNATGILALFDGMMVVGTHDEQPNADGITTTTTITLWEWEDAIGITSVVPPPLDFLLRIPPLQEESSISATTTVTSELPPPTNMP